MANMCDVQIIARGFKTKEDLARCAEILEKCDYKNDIWTPFFDAYVDTIPEKNFLTADGWCKWSSTHILDEDVNTFRKEEKNIVSIQDLATKFGATFEILGRESGCNVGEHFVIDGNGEMILEEYFDYEEICTEDYESYEDFVEDNGEIITREEFDNASEEWISKGEPETEFGDYIQHLDYVALA